MNANRMGIDATVFGRSILGHYDPCHLWNGSAAERRFWDGLACHYLALSEGAKSGWGMQEFFFSHLAAFVIHELRPNLNDCEVGYTFNAVEEILTNAGLARYHDAPRHEILEFKFYQIAKTTSIPRLAAFFNDNWACARIAVRSAMLPSGCW